MASLKELITELHTKMARLRELQTQHPEIMTELLPQETSDLAYATKIETGTKALYDKIKAGTAEPEPAETEPAETEKSEPKTYEASKGDLKGAVTIDENEGTVTVEASLKEDNGVGATFDKDGKLQSVSAKAKIGEVKATANISKTEQELAAEMGDYGAGLKVKDGKLEEVSAKAKVGEVSAELKVTKDSLEAKAETEDFGAGLKMKNGKVEEVSAKAKVGKVEADLKIGNGELEANAKAKISDSLSAEMKITHEKIHAEATKSFSLGLETPPLPLIGLFTLSGYLNAEAALTPHGEVNWKDQIAAELGLKAELSLTAGLKLALNLVVIEMGAKIEAIIKATLEGAVHWAENKLKTALKETIVALDLAFKVFIGAPKFIQDLWASLGGDPAKLMLEKELGHANLLNLILPAWEDGKFQGKPKLEVGKDILAKLNPIKTIGEALDKFVAAIKKVAEFLKGIFGKIIEFIKSAAESFVNLFRTKAQRQKISNDKTFNKVVQDAITQARTNEKVIHILAEHKSDDERMAYLNKYVREDAAVKAAAQAIYETGDKEALGRIEEQLKAGFKDFKIIPSAGKFYLGSEAKFGISLDSQASAAAKLTVEVRCNEKMVETETREVMIEAKMKPLPFAIELPEMGDTTDAAKWEIYAKLDFLGELSDMETTLPIQIAKDPKAQTPQVEQPSAANTQVAASLTLNKTAFVIGGESAEFLTATLVYDCPEDDFWASPKQAWAKVLIGTTQLSAQVNIRPKKGGRAAAKFMIALPASEEVGKHKKTYANLANAKISVGLQIDRSTATEASKAFAQGEFKDFFTSSMMPALASQSLSLSIDPKAGQY